MQFTLNHWHYLDLNHGEIDHFALSYQNISSSSCYHILDIHRLSGTITGSPTHPCRFIIGQRRLNLVCDSAVTMLQVLISTRLKIVIFLYDFLAPQSDYPLGLSPILHAYASSSEAFMTTIG